MPRKALKKSTRFPWRGQFATVEEIKEYFAQDTLICLLCGKEFICLSGHIHASHEISSDDYREQFGIPWTYGLSGHAFRQAASKRFKKMRKDGLLPPAPSKEHIKKLHASQDGRRGTVAAFRNDSRRKVLEIHGREKKWGAEDLNEYLRRISEGRTPAEVSCDEDMPSTKVFYKFLKENPKFENKYEKIWGKLPYSVHVRAAKLGEKFQKAVIKLRRKGLEWAEIGRELGTSEHAARTTWHKLKKQGKLKVSDLKHENRRYTSEDYDEYLRRIASGRLITEVGKDQDMPQTDLFHIYLKKNEAFRKKFDKMWEDLPYVQQARSRRMGKGFKKEVIQLRKQGHNGSEIGKLLGVGKWLVESI